MGSGSVSCCRDNPGLTGNQRGNQVLATEWLVLVLVPSTPHPSLTGNRRGNQCGSHWGSGACPHTKDAGLQVCLVTGVVTNVVTNRGSQIASPLYA